MSSPCAWGSSHSGVLGGEVDRGWPCVPQAPGGRLHLSSPKARSRPGGDAGQPPDGLGQGPAGVPLPPQARSVGRLEATPDPRRGARNASSNGAFGVLPTRQWEMRSGRRALGRGTGAASASGTLKGVNWCAETTNPCSTDNGGCQELCLYRGGFNYTCACSHGRVAADGRTCQGEPSKEPTLESNS